MYFKHNGDEYRLGFRYLTEKEKRELRPVRRGGVTLRTIEEKERRSAQAILWKKVDGPAPRMSKDPNAPFHWENVAESTAECSLKDRWNRVRGREIALGRLRLILPADLAAGALQAYAER